MIAMKNLKKSTTEMLSARIWKELIWRREKGAAAQHYIKLAPFALTNILYSQRFKWQFSNRTSLSAQLPFGSIKCGCLRLAADVNAKRSDQEQLEELDDKLFNYLKLKRAVKRKATEQFNRSMQRYHRSLNAQKFARVCNWNNCGGENGKEELNCLVNANYVLKNSFFRSRKFLIMMMEFPLQFASKGKYSTSFLENKLKVPLALHKLLFYFVLRYVYNALSNVENLLEM